MEQEFKIYFFKDSSGREPVKEYLEELNNSKSVIKQKLYKKVVEYLELLSQKGNFLGEPYVKYLQYDIWELRPKNERILYACIVNHDIYLLHHFTKKTRKTPLRELRIAKKRVKLLKGGTGNG